MQIAEMKNDLISIRPSCATHRLVLLHGWGADANDLIPLGQTLSKGLNPRSIELVALNAPQKHPEGIGRQWYGLFPPDWDAIPPSIEELSVRIKAICSSSIPLERTVLLGFSQGGAMAIDVGSKLPLAGLIGCSAYPHPQWVPSQKSPPVLLFHGEEDEVVPYEASRKLITSLKANAINADLVLFEGGHEIPTKLLPKMELTLQKWFI